jgi:LysR family transcriptional regulator, benzoate and cis,cis-muconate-responsive activator of ben and cat genes
VELRHLRYFVRVAEQGSFTGAGALLNVAQQGLSKQVADLEHELGVQLLIRTGRGVRLTPAGTAFFQEARTILVQTERAVANLRARFGGGPPVLQVGFPPVSVIQTEVLPALLGRLRSLESGIVTNLHELPSGRVLRALLDRTLDLGLVLAYHDDYPELRAELVGVHQLSNVLLPVNHPCASAERVRLADLADTPLLYSERDNGAHAHHEQPSRIQGAGRADQARVAATGAWIPWFGEELLEPGVVSKPLADPPFSIGIWVVGRRHDNYPLVENFLDECPDLCCNLSPAGAFPTSGPLDESEPVWSGNGQAVGLEGGRGRSVPVE